MTYALAFQFGMAFGAMLFAPLSFLIGGAFTIFIIYSHSGLAWFKNELQGSNPHAN